jgi:hypothetical protein
VSTFNFNSEGNVDDTLIRECQARTCTYEVWENLGNIRPPLALTCWSDDDVVIALPPVTCDPKIIKITLPRGQAASEGAPENCGCEGSIFTVREPIYFPTTTPCRNPQLIYRSSGPGEDSYLYLGLGPQMPRSDGGKSTDNDGHGHGDGDDEASTRADQASPPVVLRWKISSGDGWRPWNVETDKTASELKKKSVVERLRGKYIDSDKPFSVPIRGGLNWSRKGFLSCG